MAGTGRSPLNAALEYADRGWQVFPCVESGKRPATRHGFKGATTDPETIRNWWKRRPARNLAIRTGVASLLVVLDVDPRHGGDASLGELTHQHGALPETAQSRTGSGGSHLYFNGSLVEVAHSCTRAMNASCAAAVRSRLLLSAPAGGTPRT